MNKSAVRTIISTVPATPALMQGEELSVRRRDAIIFFPGLGALEPSLAHVTETLRNEFDRAYRAPRAQFVLHPTPTPAGDRTELVQTICRVDGSERVPIADVYGVDYETMQNAAAAPTNPLIRAVTLALTVLAAMLIWLKAFLRHFFTPKPKPRGQMLQLLACLAVLFLLGGYLIMAVVAVIQLAFTAYASVTHSAALQITLPQGVVIVGAVLGALLPGARDLLSQAAEQYLRVIRYLWTAAARNNLRGEVLTLIEHVSERPEIGHIHIVGHSFGSIVAIDLVFPASKPPTARMKHVKSLCTIGCPFDLVRMLHPHYFSKRFAAANAGLHWINIYDPIDVLGSNFRDDHTQGDATVGVQVNAVADENSSANNRQHRIWRDTMFYGWANDANDTAGSPDQMTKPPEQRPDENIPWNPGQKLTPVSGLMLASIRSHVQYWGTNPNAESALGYLVSQLFKRRRRQVLVGPHATAANQGSGVRAVAQTGQGVGGLTSAGNHVNQPDDRSSATQKPQGPRTPGRTPQPPSRTREHPHVRYGRKVTRYRSS